MLFIEDSFKVGCPFGAESNWNGHLLNYARPMLEGRASWTRRPLPFWLVMVAEEAAPGTRGAVLALVEPSRALRDLATALGNATMTLECLLAAHWAIASPEHHYFPGATASRP